MSYRALVRCKRIATTSPIQWRQRDLPGGAREQSQNIPKSNPKSQKSLSRAGGVGGGAAPPRGHPSPPFQAAESSSGGRLLKEFPGGMFNKVSPASSAKVRNFFFIKVHPPLAWNPATSSRWGLLSHLLNQKPLPLTMPIQSVTAATA